MSEAKLPVASSPAGAEFTNEIVPNLRSLHLCPNAEPRLVEAFSDDAFIVVNGLMLVKGSGETVGIALREESLPGGITESGAWYEIDYGKTEWDKRSAIRAAFVRGDTHISLSGVTKWFKNRDVRVNQVCPGEDLSQKARQAAERLQPGKHMPDGLSRKEYLNRHLLFPEP